ncbi:hypothetical protein GCM10022398_29880 [Acetobacter lovaniensis]|nr:hypothetical protein AA0474_1992 [Acetobacter lovaniensis NRIC 0474]
MSLKNPEDRLTREGLIVRLYNAYCGPVETKDQALDLISEIAKAVDGNREPPKKKSPNLSADKGKKIAAKIAG